MAICWSREHLFYIKTRCILKQQTDTRAPPATTSNVEDASRPIRARVVESSIPRRRDIETASPPKLPTCSLLPPSYVAQNLTEPDTHTHAYKTAHDTTRHDTQQEMDDA